MSVSLAHIIHRASTDAQFLTQLQANPEATMTAYGISLSDEERAALLDVKDLFAQQAMLSARAVNPAEPETSWPSGPSFTHAAIV